MMKKVLCAAIAIVVVLLVAGGVYVNYQKNHPDSSYDAIPRELYSEMMKHWPSEKFGERFFGNSNIHYYGTHGDCVVFSYDYILGMSIGFNSSAPYEYEVAGSTFYIDGAGSGIMVYHDGEFEHIYEAYQRRWLNRWQIKSIAQYHEQRLINKYGK